MRKLAFAALAIVTLSVLVWGVAFVPAHAEEAAIPESFTLHKEDGKQGPVTFPHAAHFAVTECVTCHHTNEGLTAETAASTEVATCGSCHDAPEKEGVPDTASMSLTKNAFHISCVGCHKESAKADAALSLPTKCTECHVKE